MTTQKVMGRMVAGVILLAASSVAMAAGMEVGLITQATGTVQVMAPGSKTAPAVSFAKPKAGSRKQEAK